MEINNLERKIIVRENKVPRVLSGMVIIFDLIVLLLVVCSDLQGNKTVKAGYILCAVFFVTAVLLLMDYFLRRLTIGDYQCVYRSMFGLKRRFSVSEIGQIRISIGSDAVIRLYDQTGKLLVRFEGNMIGAEEALSWLKERGIPAVTKEGALMKMRTGEAGGEPEEWAEHPFFYQSAGWIKAIRILLWAVNLGGFILAVVVLRYLSFNYACPIYISVPLADYILYLCFYRVIALEKPKNAGRQWEDSHVNFPWFPFALLVLLMLHEYFFVNIRSLWVYWCIPVVGFLLALLLKLVVHPRWKYGKFSIILLCIALFFAVFIEIPYVNWACTTAPPEHVYAVVTEKEKSSGARGSSVTVYHLNVKMIDGSTADLCTSSGIFNRVQPYDYVIVCKRRSIFGVEYWIVHL